MAANLDVLGYNLPCSDPHAELDRLANRTRAGYQSLMLAYWWLEQPPELIEEAVSRFRELSLRPYSVHGFRFMPGLGEEPESILPYHREVLRNASLYGVRVITHHFTYCTGLTDADFADFGGALERHGIDREGYLAANIGLLREICREAEPYGITVAIENLPGGLHADFVTRVEDLVAIIHETKAPNLGICFDSGHAHISGLNLYQQITQAGELLCHTHFHDNVGRISARNIDNDLHQPCGIGSINWLEVIAGLHEVGYRSPVTFELKDPDLDLPVNLHNWEWLNALFETKFRSWEFPLGLPTTP